MALDPSPFDNIGLIGPRKCQLKTTWMQKQLGPLAARACGRCRRQEAPTKASPWARNLWELPVPLTRSGTLIIWGLPLPQTVKGGWRRLYDPEPMCIFWEWVDTSHQFHFIYRLRGDSYIWDPPLCRAGVGVGVWNLGCGRNP